MPAGLFITHVDSPRVRGHFQRLADETRSLINWHFVLNPTPGIRPRTPFPVRPPAKVMPGRHEQMIRNGGALGGYLDVVIVPCVLALRARHVWVMEYDVDYAGHWRDLFDQFADSPADLLTSTITPLEHNVGWSHWRTASAPAWVEPRHLRRAFHPLMRVSRQFAQQYAVMMSDTHWRGHYEFTLTTAATVSGAAVEDLGAVRPVDPAAGLRQNYVNDPLDPQLSPGTFVWRPARDHYFHERPDAFTWQNLLYHPVKPAVASWRPR